MLCEFFGGQTMPKKVKRQHSLNGKLYIVENGDTEVCTECGERYFHARTLDEIDSLLGAEHDVKDRIEVEVVSFA